MTETPPRPAVVAGLGCDFSTHKVHLARVVRDAVELTRIVNLDKLGYRAQVEAVVQSLVELVDVGQLVDLSKVALLVERPFVHIQERQNFGTTIQMAQIGSMVRTCAAFLGIKTSQMFATEWRPLAGIIHEGRQPMSRDEAKRAALKLVKLEYGLDCGRDDNLAEACLMGRVAYGLAAQQVRLEAGA